MAASSCFMVTFRAVHPLRNSVTSGASALDFHFLLTGFGLADGPLQRATPPPASAVLSAEDPLLCNQVR